MAPPSSSFGSLSLPPSWKCKCKRKRKSAPVESFTRAAVTPGADLQKQSQPLHLCCPWRRLLALLFLPCSRSINGVASRIQISHLVVVAISLLLLLASSPPDLAHSSSSSSPSSFLPLPSPTLGSPSAPPEKCSSLFPGFHSTSTSTLSPSVDIVSACSGPAINRFLFLLLTQGS